MAVTLPSDIVADVMRNADPARRRAAEARLHSAGTQFAGLLDAIQQDAVANVSSATRKLPLTPLHATVADAPPRDVDKATAAQGFERMVLRNLFETLLPDEQSGAFGAGPSAGIWRSMAADQLAGVYADAGGVGIARMLQAPGENVSPLRDSQWPYFAMQPIKTFAG